MKNEITSRKDQCVTVNIKGLIVSSCLALFFAGCASTSQKDSEFLGNVKYIEGENASSAEAARKQAEEEAELARAEADRLREEMAQRDREAAAARESAQASGEVQREESSVNMPTDLSIYFGYDEFAVLDEYSGMLSKHAEYLQANPEILVRLEGNCDERGGREYNLALGSKRSEAVKSMLTGLGVNAQRIESISYGKEKPMAMGNDEESYRLNRRVDIIYR